MKKLFIILLLLFLVTGCSVGINDSKTDYKEFDYGDMYFYTDEDTCVEYIVYVGYYKGGITTRLNADGTVKINEECLNSKGE